MRTPAFALPLLVIACAPSGSNAAAGGADAASSAAPFNVEVIADFDEPWAMTFIPDTPYALITEKKGALLLWEKEGEVRKVAGVPEVDYGGQGGFGDVVLAPDFATTQNIYLSWIEAGSGNRHGAVVGVAKLNLNAAGGPALEGLRTIWEQSPKVTGRGHYSHRIAFSPDGKHLFIASGERQKFDPAQDMDANLGKVVRLYPDGTTPQDNPFYDAANPVRSQIWSLGHRNILGLAFRRQRQSVEPGDGPKRRG